MVDCTPMSASEALSVRYGVPRWNPAWAVPEVPVPESDTHDLAIEYLRGVLLAWAQTQGRPIKVARNLGIRWVRSEPRAGFDPDLCLLDPWTRGPGTLNSLKLWESDVSAPRLAVEIVSASHPYKDYVDTPERCAAAGVGELWVYDPLMAGPKAHGGPHLLQVWGRKGPEMVRLAAGVEPVHSPLLGAFLRPIATDHAGAARLEVWDSPTGGRRWPTLRELERAESERQRAEDGRRHAAEVAAKDARIAELEAELRAKSSRDI